jgi:hypothetical protein
MDEQMLFNIGCAVIIIMMIIYFILKFKIKPEVVENGIKCR